MRGLLWLLAAFALAAAMSIVMRENEAYVLLVYAPWRVELSLNLLVVVLMIGFVAFYFLVRIVSHTLQLPAYVRTFRAREQERKGRDALAQSLQMLYEGRYGRAEKYSAQAYALGGTRALAALIAARAAQRMRKFSLRDSWVARAREADPEWRQAALAVQADLLLEERRYDDARAVLRELQAGGARHIATLTALLRAEQGLENWEEVVRLARLLDKRQGMPTEVLQSIVGNAVIAMLSRKALDARALAEFWRSVLVPEQRLPRIAAAAARAWLQLGDYRSARRVIEDSLAADWSTELVLLYGQCGEDDAIERIERAEGWLKSHPRDAELLLTLGRLCARRELWGKARSYFEAGLALNAGKEAHLALASLCERTGRDAEAQHHFRAAAEAL